MISDRLKLFVLNSGRAFGEQVSPAEKARLAPAFKRREYVDYLDARLENLRLRRAPGSGGGG